MDVEDYFVEFVFFLNFWILLILFFELVYFYNGINMILFWVFFILEI